MTLFLFLLLIGSPLAASAQKPEPITTEVQSSATVVKAEFGETIWAVTPVSDGTYALNIRVPNTGSYDASDITIAATTVVNWHYLSSNVSVPAEVTVIEDQPIKHVDWRVPTIAIGEAVTIKALFAYGTSSNSQIPVEVHVDSRVSAPVSVQTVNDGESATSTEATETSNPSTTSSIWQWFRQLLKSMAHWLNEVFRSSP